MKTGNRILLAAFALFISAAVVMLVSMVSVFYRSGMIITEKRTGETVSTEYDFTHFDSVNLEGFEHVKISRNNTYSVSVTIPGKRTGHVMVNEVNGVLSVRQDYMSFDSGDNAEVVIYVPSLKRISCRDGVNLVFSGFKDDRIEILTEGFNEIAGSDIRVENMLLSGNGIVNIDLASSEVMNAVLDLDGMGTVNLNMTGGKLEGRLRNMIDVVYTGQVSLRNIDLADECGVTAK